MDGVVQVNPIVTDLVRARQFGELLGWSSTPRHAHAAVISLPNGTVSGIMRR